MSDNIKLVIEIPKSALNLLNTTGVDWLDAEHILSAVAHGIPLDDDSERAEVQAYFAGQTYGWEEGRKALLDDVKAEIENIPNDDTTKPIGTYDYCMGAENERKLILSIIDKYIGGKE